MKDKDGCWVQISPKVTVKVVVTYPADYKGLCLGVWANIFLVFTVIFAALFPTAANFSLLFTVLFFFRSHLSFSVFM